MLLSGSWPRVGGCQWGNAGNLVRWVMQYGAL